MSIVKYKNFSIKYNLLETHLAHAPMRVTSNGGIWEKKLYKIYEYLLHEDDIVIDIGAYIGTHALPMAMLCNKVYAFECNEIIFNCLRENIVLNDLEHKIKPHDICLSNKEDQLKFYERENGTSRVSSRNIIGNCRIVKTNTLDNIIGLDTPIKLIKIDCEGHEFKVLEGAKGIIEKHSPYILIEVFKRSLNELDNWLIHNYYSKTHLKGDDYYLSPI